MRTPTLLAKKIPIPSPKSINGGLNSPHNASVIKLLGKPTSEHATKLRVTMDVGPFTLTGLKPFLETLRDVFAKVKKERPDLYHNLKQVGCWVIRPVRGSNSVISDHSWGLAVDLYFGDAVTPRGSGLTEQGLLELYPYFHNAQIYWGAEFPTDDGMHWGASLELLQRWAATDRI